MNVDVSKLLTDTDEFHVQYDFDLAEDGTKIVLNRTVWKKARARKNQDLLHIEAVAEFPAELGIALVRDLASCLAYATV